MPLGTAHEASVPSCSRRRSQCRRVAWCSCTTKRPVAAGFPSPAPPAGSGVSVKARFARYSARRSLAIGSAVAVLFLVGLAVGLGGVLLLGEILLADAHLDLRLGGAVLGVLAQLLLGHLEALGLAAARLVDRVHGRVVGHVLLEIARRTAADVARLFAGQIRLFLGQGVVLVGHALSILVRVKIRRRANGEAAHYPLPRRRARARPLRTRRARR